MAVKKRVGNRTARLGAIGVSKRPKWNVKDGDTEVGILYPTKRGEIKDTFSPVELVEEAKKSNCVFITPPLWNATPSTSEDAQPVKTTVSSTGA